MDFPTELIFNFLFNFVVALIIVRFIFYPAKQSKGYVFSFMVFNTVVFFMISFLNSIELSIGVGFSLFGIFSILRYRTNPIPIREMTYLFVLLALPVLNAILLGTGVLGNILAANLLIILILFIMEKEWGFDYVSRRTILYENIALAKPERYEDLIVDLNERTGLEIIRCEVGKMNFLNDTVQLKIYYKDANGFSINDDDEIIV